MISRMWGTPKVLSERALKGSLTTITPEASAPLLPLPHLEEVTLKLPQASLLRACMRSAPHSYYPEGLDSSRE